MRGGGQVQQQGRPKSVALGRWAGAERGGGACRKPVPRAPLGRLARARQEDKARGGRGDCTPPCAPRHRLVHRLSRGEHSRAMRVGAAPLQQQQQQQPQRRAQGCGVGRRTLVVVAAKPPPRNAVKYGSGECASVWERRWRAGAGGVRPPPLACAAATLAAAAAAGWYEATRPGGRQFRTIREEIGELPASRARPTHARRRFAPPPSRQRLPPPGQPGGQQRPRAQGPLHRQLVRGGTCVLDHCCPSPPPHAHALGCAGMAPSTRARRSTF